MGFFLPKSDLLTKFLATTHRSLLPTFHYNNCIMIVVMKRGQRRGSPTSCGKRAPTTVIFGSRAFPCCRRQHKYNNSEPTTHRLKPFKACTPLSMYNSCNETLAAFQSSYKVVKEAMVVRVFYRVFLLEEDIWFNTRMRENLKSCRLDTISTPKSIYRVKNSSWI